MSYFSHMFLHGRLGTTFAAERLMMTKLHRSVDNDSLRPLLRRGLFGADRPLPAFLEHTPEPNR